MSRPPIVAKEIQISYNGIIFTIQVTLVEESAQIPPPSPQPVDTLKIVNDRLVYKRHVRKKNTNYIFTNTTYLATRDRIVPGII